LKMKLKGQRFETVSDIQRESQAELNSIGKWLPQCFWCVEKTMRSLYTFPRRQFSRWQSKLGKLSLHFFFNLVQELSDSTSYREIEATT
jgi:hypothetical protein